MLRGFIGKRKGQLIWATKRQTERACWRVVYGYTTKASKGYGFDSKAIESLKSKGWEVVRIVIKEDNEK